MPGFRSGVERAHRSACPWPKLDLKAFDQTVARLALSAMALKNDSGQRIAKRSVTAVECVDPLRARIALLNSEAKS